MISRRRAVRRGVVRAHRGASSGALDAPGRVFVLGAHVHDHAQADHLSSLSALVERTGAQAYLLAGAEVRFERMPLADRELLELRNDASRHSPPG